MQGLTGFQWTLDHILSINMVCCVHMKAQIPILVQKQPLKDTFQFGIFWDWNVRRSVNCLIWDVFRPLWAATVGGGDKWMKSKTVRCTPPGLFRG